MAADNSKLRIEQYIDRHPAYYTWRAMMHNCGLTGHPLDPKDRKYYSDAGVTVCEAWRKFSNYEQWISTTGWKRKSGLYVVRKDKTKGFCPENCVVVSKTQAENLRSNVFRVGGKSVRDMLPELPEGRNRRQQRVRQRIAQYGWDARDAVERPVTPHNMLTKLHLNHMGVSQYKMPGGIDE